MEQRPKSSLLRLAAQMRPYLGLLIGCVLCVLLVNAADLVKPYVAKVVIDGFLVGSEEQSGLYSIAGMGVLYVIVALVGAAMSLLQVRMIAKMSQSILHTMRMEVFEKILLLPMKVLDKYGTGRLITRATNDVEAVGEFYTDVFLNLFRDVFLLMGIVVVMLFLDWRLALVSFVGIPVIAILSFSLKSILRKNFQKMKQIIGRINGFFAENVAGMKIVQAFHRQADKLKEFRDLNRAYFKTTRTQVMLNTVLRPVMDVIYNLVIALLIVFGYHRISGNLLEIGVLYAFTNYVRQFFDPINDLAEKYTTVQSAFVSTDRIYEILDTPELEEPDTGTHGGAMHGDVEFKNVFFAYEDEWILKDVSFKVPAGSRAAFVGSTGAGKTTIISLLNRSYTAQKGEVLVDGVPVGDWKLRDLRRGVATVLQDVFLFSGTIGENIDMYAGLDQETIAAALDTAGAGEFTDRAGTGRVTEQGLNFSTGQRQLLSFARAVAHKPAILVLDEATAHIDTETERIVQQSLARISEGRTAIYIAHRLSTIRDCDCIFVLEDGEIVEQGTHEELFRKDGVYRRLIAAQAEEESA